MTSAAAILVPESAAPTASRIAITTTTGPIRAGVRTRVQD